MTKLFRITCTTPKYNPPGSAGYVDWYNAETAEEAKAIHAEDMHRYGLPADSHVEIVECNPETLKPV